MVAFITSALLLVGFWVILLAGGFGFYLLWDLWTAGELPKRNRRRTEAIYRESRVMKLEHKLDICDDRCPECARV